ncbi:PucR family transcriptional regulator ligand-binding domain-containing protein [Alkalihalophilus pseudofirmus]|uniref:PucR family transcriptional regulator n=1 Tax=Alkalihalophilus pseudofirmus TaxID=79885 RepID=UPI00259B30EC|nr:PucR family transcriptional regulator [Alkalihalophilus pseudofirmus]WEG18424.1 PucR family transcriptional regulator ligand-binding domain-containing protein [Alkalihalophilus pseudofirmus]
MKLTMDEVLSLPLLKDAVHHTSVDLQTKKVEWIQALEAPVEQFVRPNELILTTAVGCLDDEQLFDFVCDIIDSKASGLAIAVGKFVKQIPEKIIKKANKENFILLEMEWDIRFSDVIKEALHLLDTKKRQHYHQIESLQETLLDFILKGKKLQDVCEYVANTLKAPVLITDNRGSLYGSSKQVTSSLITHFNQYLHKQLTENGIIFNHSSTIEWFQYEEDYALVLGVESANQLKGYIIVGGFGPKPFASTEYEEWGKLLKHVSTAIALFFLHETAVKETEWLLRDDFVWELASGGVHSSDTLSSRAKSLGYRLNLPYVSLVATPEYFKQRFEQEDKLQMSYDHWLHYQIRQIEEEAEKIAKKQALKAMITYQQDELIIFLEVIFDQAAECAMRFINEFEERLSFLYPSIQFSWGISKQYGYHLFQECYQEAKKALTLGKKRNGRGSRNLFTDTKIDRLIEAMSEVSVLTEFTNHLLDSLIHYSKERNIDLLHTFMTYHSHKGNVSQTARALNLHRQSLLYRLRKIEALTGCSLDNADDLFLLDLSTRLWSAGQEEQ